jgi:hypothetical protein
LGYLVGGGRGRHVVSAVDYRFNDDSGTKFALPDFI